MSTKSPLYAQFEQTSTEDGIWITMLESDEGAPEFEVRVRSTRSRRAQRVRNELMQAHLKSGSRERNDQKEAVEMLARAIIVDWRGPAAVDKNGDPMPYSEANVRTLMTDLPWLAEKVLLAATMDEAYRRSAVERVVGN